MDGVGSVTFAYHWGSRALLGNIAPGNALDLREAHIELQGSLAQKVLL
jgi:hypothetical protein